MHVALHTIQPITVIEAIFVNGWVILNCHNNRKGLYYGNCINNGWTSDYLKLADCVCGASATLALKAPSIHLTTVASAIALDCTTFIAHSLLVQGAFTRDWLIISPHQFGHRRECRNSKKQENATNDKVKCRRG